MKGAVSVVRRVLLVDDHAIVRESVRQLLDRSGWIEVVAQADRPGVALDLAVEHRPDVIVMDLSMPDGGGLAAIRSIREALPGTVFVVLSMYGDRQAVELSMREGVRGFVTKGDDPADLLRAIDLCSSGGMYFSPGVSTTGMEASRDSRVRSRPLSDREDQILLLVGRGHSLKEAAATAGLAYKTAHQHLKAAMRKLGLESIQEVVREVVQRDRFNTQSDASRTV